MTYIREELRAARIAEASRRYASDKRSVLDHLADLYEANWQPPPKDDADTLAMRAALMGHTNLPPTWIDEGRFDDKSNAKIFRAGLAHARAEVPDLAELIAAARDVVDRWGPGSVIVPEHIQRLRRALPDSGKT